MSSQPPPPPHAHFTDEQAVFILSCYAFHMSSDDMMDLYEERFGPLELDVWLSAWKVEPLVSTFRVPIEQSWLLDMPEEEEKAGDEKAAVNEQKELEPGRRRRGEHRNRRSHGYTARRRQFFMESGFWKDKTKTGGAAQNGR